MVLNCKFIANVCTLYNNSNSRDPRNVPALKVLLDGILSK